MPKPLATLQSTAFWYVHHHLKSVWLQHVSPLMSTRHFRKSRISQVVLSQRQPSFSALALLSVASMVQLSTFHICHSLLLMSAALDISCAPFMLRAAPAGRPH